MIKNRLVVGVLAAILFTFTGSTSAFAHITVQPEKAGVSEFLTFNTSVPNEKDVPTTSIRLIIPDNLNYVTPTVKQGWTIETKTTGSGEGKKITEINWTGGKVPANFRDDFTFSAQTPEKTGTINWKVYQTYADGEVVAWDQAPSDKEGSKPYSQTVVENDLATETKTSETSSDQSRANIALALSGLALVGTVGAFLVRTKK